MKKTTKPRTFNLTPKRVEALRLIQKTPDIYVGGIAQTLLAGERVKRGLWSQAATRMGAVYCIRLEEQGLITINKFVDSGFGRVTITPKGEEALRKIDAADSLDAAIARSVTA